MAGGKADHVGDLDGHAIGEARLTMLAKEPPGRLVRSCTGRRYRSGA